MYEYQGGVKNAKVGKLVFKYEKQMEKGSDIVVNFVTFVFIYAINTENVSQKYFQEGDRWEGGGHF